MKYVNDFIKFLKESPSSYHAIANLRKLINKDGECFSEDIEKGKKCIFYKESKSGATLVAFDIGEEVKSNSPFNIIMSHADSPWFKVQGEDLSIDGFNLIPTESYGGIINSTWYDRPLTIAGRVKVNENGNETYKLVHLKDETMLIPNCCTHFSKFIENDKNELIDNGNPIIGTKRNLKDLLTKHLKLKYEDILDYDLNLIPKSTPCLWGDDKEYLSSGRLDDLAAAYSSTLAFMNCHNKKAINVLYVSDNEEIGSNTDVGAFSSFLKDHIDLVCEKLGIDEEKAFSKSFMISADNAQGVNPHYDYLFNPDYKVYMNKGLALKYSERYSTSEKSAELFKKMCDKKGLPYQEYKNRDGIPGGGTIGKIVQMQMDILSVDVGVPQLAMHSSFETMGSADIKNSVDVFKAFYKGRIKVK